MWLLTRVAVFFYLAIILSTGLLCILFFLHLIDLAEVVKMLTNIYEDTQLSTVMAVVVGFIMFISLLWAKLIYARRQKERTIAFDNPSGPVSVSLNAMEDLIRRIAVRVPEIKEIRPTIIATKKGLDIESRLILRSDVNIPETTARLQEMIRSKVQDVIGIDGKINIRIHVIKIISEELKYKKEKGKAEIEVDPTPTVPFRGYRA
ncbi:MAG: alkaline shock response membrane anchor protein AmaP [Candidatus Omnitrophica bacterium]|nr:alkaline shock response membrane anchor protein AmaP [Candidatus Omnitrophota bacterium]